MTSIVVVDAPLIKFDDGEETQKQNTNFGQNSPIFFFPFSECSSYPFYPARSLITSFGDPSWEVQRSEIVKSCVAIRILLE